MGFRYFFILFLILCKNFRPGNINRNGPGRSGKEGFCLRRDRQGKAQTGSVGAGMLVPGCDSLS